MIRPTVIVSTALLLLALAAAPARGESVVERTPAELPGEIATDTRLIVVSERAGFVHWGVNGWALPDRAVWPEGTAQVNARAVETALVGPGPDGRFRAALGPFRAGVGSLELVLRHSDGSWTNNGRADYRVAVRAAAPTRRRPITIGAGPRLGTSSGREYFEDLQDWEYLDCRGVEPADDGRDLGDGQATARDLIAFYSRREAGRLLLRADLLELGLGAERGALDLVVLIDCAPGGQTWLPDFVKGQCAWGWDLAVIVRDGGEALLLDAAWQRQAGFVGASFRADLDAVELGLEQAALRRAGWDGSRALGFGVYTTRDGDPRIADALLEADLADGRLDTRIAEDRLAGTAKWSSILHGNQSVQPLAWVEALVENRQLLTPGGRPTGYRRALDTHELFRVPVNIHVSGTLAALLQWARPEFNARIRGFLDGRPENGEGALVGGVLAEHIMPYFENPAGALGGDGVNDASFRLNEELLDRIYGPGSRAVFWTPERVIRDSTFADVLHGATGRPTGYRFTVIDQVTHLAQWFGQHDAHGRNGHKINRIHGVSCFVINDTADQWKFANSDGGLWIWTRRDLLAKALDGDQEQLTLVFDDWEAFSGRSFTSFGVGNDNPDNYENTVRWIANHPWIQAVTLDDVAGWGWREVDRGSPRLQLETYDWLRHASEGSYDRWYFGSGQEEAFAQLRPERAPGLAAPKVYGAVGQPGTVLHDVWARVARAPRNRLRSLAEAVYGIDVFETAWHDEDQNDYLSKTASGEYAAPDTTWDRTSGWALAMHARVGDAGLVAAAAEWAARPPVSARAWRADVDEDGEEELLLADARAFYAFEDDGGRLVLACVRDPRTGEAESFVCGLLQTTGDLAYRDRAGEQDGQTYRPHGLIDWWATGAGRRYLNDAYAVEALTAGWRLRSPDGAITKEVTIEQGRLRVRYALAPRAGTLYVRTGLSPATLDLFMGAPLQDAVLPGGGVEVSTRTARGVEVRVALEPQGGASLNPFAAFGGRGPRGISFAHQVEVSGQGSFGFDLVPELR